MISTSSMDPTWYFDQRRVGEVAKTRAHVMGDVMSRPNFDHAPPPVRVNGRLLVPVHVTGLGAMVIFDARSRTAVCQARLAYNVGPNTGYPLWDLRQSITHAWIDGVPIAPSSIAELELGEGPAATLRVIPQSQAAGSAHTLRLRYALGIPRSDLGGAYPPVLRWSDQGLRWSIGMADLFAGRHLEAWFPSNLPFDQFPFRLLVKLVGFDAPHVLITNGQALRVGRNTWSVVFPDWFTSLSQLIELHRADEVKGVRRTIRLSQARDSVCVEVWKLARVPGDVHRVLKRTADLIKAIDATYGPFPGNRYVCFLHGAQGGMEYSYAATTSEEALAHEVLHSWFARSVSQATDADGWWKEAFTTYRTSRPMAIPFSDSDQPLMLCSRRPFQRTTPREAYTAGARFFSGVAHAVGGTYRLDVLMRRLYERRAGTPLSTLELEEFLVAESGAVSLVDAFHRYVYGLDDPKHAPILCVEGRPALSRAPGDDTCLAVRVANHGVETCKHFMVIFGLPSATRPRPAAVAGGFDLRPGESRLMSARVVDSHRLPLTTDAAILRASAHTRRRAALRHVPSNPSHRI